MRSLLFARSLLAVCAAAGFAGVAQAQVVSAQLDGFQSTWSGAVGSGFFAANGATSDFVRSGTAAGPVSMDCTNITLGDPYNPITLTEGAGTQVASMLVTNAATTGGGLSSINYQFTLDLFADGALIADDLSFDFTLEYADQNLATSRVRRVSGLSTHTFTLSGVTYEVSLGLQSASGFLLAENFWYNVAESYYDSTAGAYVWNRGAASFDLNYHAIGGIAAVSAATGPGAAVPEPSTYGIAGALTLGLIALIFRRRQVK